VGSERAQEKGEKGAVRRGSGREGQAKCRFKNFRGKPAQKQSKQTIKKKRKNKKQVCPVRQTKKNLVKFYFRLVLICFCCWGVSKTSISLSLALTPAHHNNNKRMSPGNSFHMKMDQL